jgi:hypothetical protein
MRVPRFLPRNGTGRVAQKGVDLHGFEAGLIGCGVRAGICRDP